MESGILSQKGEGAYGNRENVVTVNLQVPPELGKKGFSFTKKE